MKLAIVTTAAAFAVISGTASASYVHLTASAGHVRHCGSSNNPSHPWGDLRARRIGCRGARKVANGYSPAHHNPRGFHCKSRTSSSGEGNHVTCTRTLRGKEQLVKFLYGF
ncbi:MAG TPA: hypothetical protein VFB39_15440 [Solirubrobacteraceae bacterium]|nr:hypothetical protein [Solirubrobacteraceae bacterium]